MPNYMEKTPRDLEACGNGTFSYSTDVNPFDDEEIQPEFNKLECEFIRQATGEVSKNYEQIKEYRAGTGQLERIRGNDRLQYPHFFLPDNPKMKILKLNFSGSRFQEKGVEKLVEFIRKVPPRIKIELNLTNRNMDDKILNMKALTLLSEVRQHKKSLGSSLEFDFDKETKERFEELVKSTQTPDAKELKYVETEKKPKHSTTKRNEIPQLPRSSLKSPEFSKLLTLIKPLKSYAFGKVMPRNPIYQHKAQWIYFYIFDIFNNGISNLADMELKKEILKDINKVLKAIEKEDRNKSRKVLGVEIVLVGSYIPAIRNTITEIQKYIDLLGEQKNLEPPSHSLASSSNLSGSAKESKSGLPQIEMPQLSPPPQGKIENSSTGCDLHLMYIDEKSRHPTIASSLPKGKEGDELFIIDLTEQLSILTAWRQRLHSKQSQNPNGQTENDIKQADQSIAELEKQRLAASDESKQSTFILTYEEVEVPGNGHCLYTAVGLYVGRDQKQLRGQVADELEVKRQTYEPFLELKSQQTSKQYIEGVRSGSEWAGNAEIMALMHILQRPIIVVRPGENSQGRIQNLTEAERKSSAKKPILVKYNDKNHYNALILVAQNDPQSFTLGPAVPFTVDKVNEEKVMPQPRSSDPQESKILSNSKSFSSSSNSSSSTTSTSSSTSSMIRASQVAGGNPILSSDRSSGGQKNGNSLRGANQEPSKLSLSLSHSSMNP